MSSDFDPLGPFYYAPLLFLKHLCSSPKTLMLNLKLFVLSYAIDSIFVVMMMAYTYLSICNASKMHGLILTYGLAVSNSPTLELFSISLSVPTLSKP